MLFVELQVKTEKSRRGTAQGLSRNTDETNMRRIGASSGFKEIVNKLTAVLSD